MPYAGFMKFLLAVGILSLLHAAYSAAQREYILSVYVFLSNWKKNQWFHVLDRSYLRDTDQEKTITFLPLDVSMPNETW